jgi:hypothetical protein
MGLKKALVDIFVEAEQVRNVISGHVHAGVKASVKTAWTYKGTHFIVAPSPLPPRNFGEEYSPFLPPSEADEGYYLLVHVNGEDVRIEARKIGHGARVDYPPAFAAYTEEVDPRAFTPVGELPANEAVVNGGFEHGLDGWHKPHRYIADTEPGFEWDVGRPPHRDDDARAAWLYTREKGHAWAYDEFLEFYQLVDVAGAANPVLRASYYMPTEAKSYFGGAYLRITGFRQGEPVLRLFFHWGAREERTRHLPQAILYSELGRPTGVQSLIAEGKAQRALQWKLPDYFHRWHELVAPIAALYDEATQTEGAYADLAVDKALVAFGVWTGMEPENEAGCWFDAISLDDDPSVEEGRIGPKPLPVTADAFRIPFGRWYVLGYDK